MNGAALNAFMQLFDNSDEKRKEEKEKDRKQRLAEKSDDRQYEVQQKINDENRASNKSREKEIEAKRTNKLISENRPTIAGSDGSFGPHQNYWNISDVTKQYDPKTASDYGQKNDAYRKSLMTINSSPVLQTLISRGIPTDQILEMTGGSTDPNAIRQALGNLDAITKGVNETENTNRNAIANNSISKNAIEAIQLGETLKNPEQIAKTQALTDVNRQLTQGLGGLEPWRFVDRPQSLVVNPDGSSRVVQNPSYLGDGGTGNGMGMLTASPLEAAAAGAGYAKDPLEFDSNFNVKRKVNGVSVPTPAAIKPKTRYNDFSKDPVTPAPVKLAPVIADPYKAYGYSSYNLPGVNAQSTNQEQVVREAYAAQLQKILNGYKNRKQQADTLYLP